MEKVGAHTRDLAQANIGAIAELFPQVMTEALDAEGNVTRAIDFDALRQELSDHVVEGPRERYVLDWPGKRAAMLVANAPTRSTLRPMMEESINFDTTKNLFIEGDNLEALKILQESYIGKVKLIYIDPPYNTGNDFIYNDDFAESNREYLERTGQLDDSGAKLLANTEANGRFHSDWLSMMYSRLRLARNFLSDDGIICVSIDDNEFTNLQKLLNEVFGERNFLNSFVWVSNLKGRQIGGHGAVGTKEYILCYARKIDGTMEFRDSASRLKRLMPTVYKGMNYTAEHDEHGPYVLKNELYNTNSAFNEETRPNLVFDIYFDPSTGDVKTSAVSSEHVHSGYVKIAPHANSNGKHQFHAYRWSSKKVESESHNLAFVESPAGWRVYTKVRDVDSTNVKDLIMDISTSAGSADLKKIGVDPALFDFPKPVDLVAQLIRMATYQDSIVMDFFAGSGTTAHAVMQVNAEDAGSRRWIMVQLAELHEMGSVKDLPGLPTISNRARHRIDMAASRTAESLLMSGNDFDAGFRAFKVDSGGYRQVVATPDATQQTSLERMIDNLEADRTEMDLLTQVILDWGLDLSLAIETAKLGGTSVAIVDDSALIACFSSAVSNETVRLIAAQKPLRAAFRDSSFKTDAERINVEQIFRELSPDSQVKVI